MNMTENTVSEAIFFENAKAKRDVWLPACGGTEVPFTYEGVRWLYVWNPAKAMHKYLRLDGGGIFDNYRKEG